MYRRIEHQAFVLPYSNGGDENQQVSFFFDSRCDIDKMRISLAGNLLYTTDDADYYPGILVWSDLTNDYIGTIGMDIAYFDSNNHLVKCSEQLKPSEGIDIFFRNKIRLCGTYNLKFFSIAGNPLDQFVNPLGGNFIYLLIEYYQE